MRKLIIITAALLTLNSCQKEDCTTGIVKLIGSERATNKIVIRNDKGGLDIIEVKPKEVVDLPIKQGEYNYTITIGNHMNAFTYYKYINVKGCDIQEVTL